MQWTNALILEFLHYLEQEPGIWHPRHRTYKDRVELTKAWSRIQANMSVRISVVEMKRKRESLMATFRSINSRMRSYNMTGDDSYRTNWFAYEPMVRFLGDLYHLKTKDDTQEPIDDVDIKHELPDTNKDDSNASTTEDFFDEDADNDAAVSVSSKTSNTDGAGVATTFKPPAQDRQLWKRKDACICEIQNRDECSLYSQLLAKKLRSFDEHGREILMHEIDNFVFHAKRKKTSLEVSLKGYNVDTSIFQEHNL
ncbi:unnamed protein product [Phaedon cochleariae]|uniref:MADF domain-containing protein n=1 Tax=Phaedon cochleariae TaxID=80249 RepID=A0A9P0GMX1_PHACE|nr:unnamed protein product [Phaedon cochleariae]